MRVAAVLTCFNRRDLTISCLERWFGQRVNTDCCLTAVVVDDASTDGTADAVRDCFPAVQIISGTGSLFWCGGMRVAWSAAAAGDPDYYALLNDDTILNKYALQTMLEAVPSSLDRRIVVGAICDPITGFATYGGWRRKCGLISPGGSLAKCDTFNANCVLVPRSVYNEMGVFHDAYTHSMGDLDYGYRAARMGIEIVQTGLFVGACSKNSVSGTWQDKRLSRKCRFRHLESPKGQPWSERVTFYRRNAGWKWPLYSINPIVKILMGR